jgi:hypothetical protein
MDLNERFDEVAASQESTHRRRSRGVLGSVITIVGAGILLAVATGLVNTASGGLALGSVAAAGLAAYSAYHILNMVPWVNRGMIPAYVVLAAQLGLTTWVLTLSIIMGTIGYLGLPYGAMILAVGSVWLLRRPGPGIAVIFVLFQCWEIMRTVFLTSLPPTNFSGLLSAGSAMIGAVIGSYAMFAMTTLLRVAAVWFIIAGVWSRRAPTPTDATRSAERGEGV